jgi:diguanylate cyclase (GGDEF)-like protein
LASFLSYNIFTSNYLNKSQLQVQLDVNSEINEQLQDVVDKLEALVIEDSLTGLPNRRGLDKFLRNIVSVYKSEQTTISFLMIDIDYFKQYNDSYTHMAGDDTLKQIGGKLKEFVTSLNDYVIRFGGEEFLFINVSKSKEEMMVIAECMRREIEALKIEHTTSECSSCVTISIGLVTEKSGNLNWINQQISAADKALYKAKELGRNQVYVME